MPEKRKETRNCHDCGLEAFDSCEESLEHIPFDESLPPCKYCLRNPNPAKDAKMLTDFWDEMWFLESDKSPALEDPNKAQRILLELLHGVVQAGGD
jgi:hypothetical protein